MLDSARPTLDRLPNSVGVGYDPQHYTDIMENPAPVEWLEIHAENYMGDGGRPIAQLRHLAERFAISAHVVGLSIGGEPPPDPAHLGRLTHLLDWLQLARFSEHLGWSTHDGCFLNDLLRLPYTATTMLRVADHIDQVQHALGRQILLENPSTYLEFAETEMGETDFLRQILARTGCGLLLDINNVFVSSTNQNADPAGYINDIPLEAVGEIRLGGHSEDVVDGKERLLIDNHACRVADPVWGLFEKTVAQIGRVPVLIEWDTGVPDWQVLAAEAARAQQIMAAVTA